MPGSLRSNLPAALLLVLAAAPASADHNQINAEEKAAGWRLLFDGVSTKGWLEVTGRPFPTDSWVIEEGCLKALPNPNGIQDIRTSESFGSFELRFEWRILKAGNSGVKYLVQNTDRWTNARGLQARARGLEYQLVDDADGEGSDPSRFTGALYSIYAPKMRSSKAPGEWNQSRLVVDGNRVEHWLNGVEVVRYALDEPRLVEALQRLRKATDVVRSSPICLQNHNTPVWFRDLKIRKLD